MPETEVDWWDRIGEAKWQHVVLAIAAMAAFIALCFVDNSGCSLSIDSSATTTTVRER